LHNAETWAKNRCQKEIGWAMKEIEFYKMSGAGNDFILVDNRTGVFDFEDAGAAAAKLCRRGMSVGADGLILIEKPGREGIDFRWRFYNADGSDASMCGNGARCAARLSFLLGISGSSVSFLTGAGIVRGRVAGSGRVEIGMTPPGPASLGRQLVVDGAPVTYDFVDTGVPHAVITVDDVRLFDLEHLGPKIRYHEAFAPEGTNVTVIDLSEAGSIRIRTYERGVENETKACGTGAVAAAVTAFLKKSVSPPVTVVPPSGSTLVVRFRQVPAVTDVTLEGDARIIYRGTLNPEALD
jgi:diaminopimelate epimerase